VIDPKNLVNAHPTRRAARPRALASAGDYVADHVRADILRGRFPLGSRLDQQVLADEMGVSTIPVREALQRLAAEGLIQLNPRRGAFVASVSDDEMTEIIRIRRPLEEQATRLAAPHLDRQRLVELKGLNKRMSDLADDPGEAAWSDLNRQWHFALYEASNSPILVQLISILWDRYTLYRLVNASGRQRRIGSVEEHAAVLRQLETGNAAAAARAIKNHIDHGATYVRQTIKDRVGRSSREAP
jgi:DNA-binding GntR family transcriptional regulator